HVTVVQTCSLPIFYAFADNRMPRCAEVYCQWPAGCREIPARHCPRKNHPIGPRRTGFLASTDASAYTEVSRDCFSLFRFVERERARNPAAERACLPPRASLIRVTFSESFIPLPAYSPLERFWRNTSGRTVPLS